MLNLASKRKFFFATVLTLLIAVALPSVAFAQNGRGRGRERRNERNYERNYDRRGDWRDGWNRQAKRKSNKFINGHDARDGRWDGRGPRRNRSYDGVNGYDDKNGTSYRNRRYYSNQVYGPVYQRRSYNYYPNYNDDRNRGGLLDLLVGGFIN